MDRFWVGGTGTWNTTSTTTGLPHPAELVVRLYLR
jgi:hypothetical protein